MTLHATESYRWPQGRVVAVCLLLAVGVCASGFLAHRVEARAHSCQQAADAALQGRADAAALLFATMVDERWQSMLTVAFEPLASKVSEASGRAVAALPDPTLLVPSVARADPCSETDAARRYIFRFDLRRAAFTFSGPAPSPLAQARLARALTAAARKRGNDAPFLFARDRVTGAPQAVAYSVVRDGSGAPRAVYGFSSCQLTGSRSVFAQVATEEAVQLRNQTGHGPGDSHLSVQVTDPNGRVLFRSTRSDPTRYAARATLATAAGPVTARLALAPDAGGAGAEDGLPASFHALLLTLVALSMTVLAAALALPLQEARRARRHAAAVATMSHELRTPLTQIRMFAELMRLGRLRSETDRERSLAIIDQEARRLTRLVDSMLQLAAGDGDGWGSGGRGGDYGSPLALVPTAIAPEVRSALEAYRPVAEVRHVTLAADLVEGVVAVVDPDALRQVIVNLLDNAVKYGPAGQTVRTSMEVVDGHVRIRIDDEGPGIAARDRTRIWRPFRRLRREVERGTPGNGIGLAVVWDLVRRQHGRVWVDEAPGAARGTRVVVELPVARSASTGRAAAPVPLRPRTGTRAIRTDDA